MDQWFYQAGTDAAGPVPLDEMQRLVREGTILPTTLVWTQGWADWKPASEVPELSSGFPEAAPPPPFAAPRPAVGQSPSVAPAGYPAPVRPGPALAAQAFVPPPSHLTKAILVTIFCCLPFGIVAIVKAAQVNSRAETGDVAAALKLSNDANTWGNWGLILGVVVNGIYGILALVGAFNS